MVITNRSIKLRRSEFIGGSKEQVSQTPPPIPNKLIGLQILKYPGQTVECFGFVLRIELIYTAEIKYLFEVQSALFFDNNRKRPVLDEMLNFCDASLKNMTRMFFVELQRHNISFTGGPESLSFSKEHLSGIINEELDKNYQ